MLRTLLPLLMLYVVSGAAQSAFAQLDRWGYWENGLTESWWLSSADYTAADAVNAVARWKNIGQDQTTRENAWAGDYFRGGDTHGTYFRWSPKAGFIMAHVDKCQARVMGVTYGKVELLPDVILFYPEFDKAAAKPHGHSHPLTQEVKVMKFVPIEWNGSRILVAEGEMADFGDYIAGLGKYNFSDFTYFYQTEFFAKSGERIETDQSNALVEKPAATGGPRLPRTYQHFLKHPIEATVISVGARRVRKTYSYENQDGTGASYYEPISLTAVKINAGTTQGLRRGMFMRVAEPDEGDEIRLTHVGKLTSNGIIIRDLGDDRSEVFFEFDKTRPHSKVAVGWKLTTSHL